MEVPEQRDEHSSREVCAEVGLTYRRLGHWTSKGYLVAEADGRGSGYPRRWSSDEMAVARAMCRLTDAGFTLAVAARLAREHYTSGVLDTRLGPGLRLVFTPDLWMPLPVTPAGE